MFLFKLQSHKPQTHTEYLLGVNPDQTGKVEPSPYHGKIVWKKVRIKFDFPNSLEKLFLKKVQFFLSQGERVPQDKYKLKNKYKNIKV